MFRLQVTITKHTFQYMDMSCSLPQHSAYMRLVCVSLSRSIHAECLRF